MDKTFVLNNKTFTVFFDVPFEKAKSDVILNWIYIETSTGPDHFYKLTEEAGGQVRSLLLFFNDRLKYSDNLTTIPGMLNCNLIIHSVIPFETNMYNDNFFRVKNTLKRYREGSLCRSISLYIPTVRKDSIKILEFALFHFDEITELERIHIYAKNQDEYIELCRFFQKRINKNQLQNLYVDFKYFIKRLWNFQILK